MTPFCSICVDGVDDLLPGEDGKLECGRCRGEHPRSGRYAFDEAVPRMHALAGSYMPSKQARRKGQVC